MQVLVVIYEFPPVGGGGGRAAQELCRYLARRGHAVQVVTSHAAGLPHHEHQDGYQLWRVPCGRKQLYRADLLSMGRYVLTGAWRGWRLLRTWRPDLIHVHFAVPSGPVAWALSRLSHIPYVLTAHLGDVPGGVPEKTAGWFRWAYPLTPTIWRSAARVVAVSQHTRQLAQAHYPVEIQVIPNAVDIRALDPGEIRVGHPPHLVFAGRFQPQKNPLGIVRILSGLKDLPWKCTLLGDGPLRPQVEGEILKAGLKERFRLPGWVEPDVVIAEFARHDLLFMPSLSEGLPVVGLQALAMGLAIVASRVGGFVDLVEDGENGYLISPGDEGGFRRALRSLLEEPARLLKFRQNSRARAAQFDISTIGPAYEALFTSVVG